VRWCPYGEFLAIFWVLHFILRPSLAFSYNTYFGSVTALQQRASAKLCGVVQGTELRPNSITLFSSLAARRPAREPARELVRELDRVMEFGLYITSAEGATYIQLGSHHVGHRLTF